MNTQVNINGKVYDLYVGNALNSIPEALENSGSFLSVAQLMDLKTEALKLEDSKSIEFLFDNNFLTSTPIFHHKSNTVLIGKADDEKNKNYLKILTPSIENDLRDGRLALPDNFELADVEGKKFNWKEVKSFAHTLMPETGAKLSDFWRVLADYDTNRLYSYVRRTYAFAKEKYNRTELMGVWFPEYPKQNWMGLFWFGGLGKFDNSSAYAGARFNKNSNHYSNVLLLAEHKGENVQPVIKKEVKLIVAPSLQEILAIEENSDLSQNQKIKEFKNLYENYQKKK